MTKVELYDDIISMVPVKPYDMHTAQPQFPTPEWIKKNAGDSKGYHPDFRVCQETPIDGRTIRQTFHTD